VKYSMIFVVHFEESDDLSARNRRTELLDAVIDECCDDNVKLHDVGPLFNETEGHIAH
jgi:hypothetical protein